MADKKYYCYCESNCKYETMTKEQILAAIEQAVSEGTIGDVDTGFITTIKTINGIPLKFFVGRQYEYEALTAEEKENLFAIITNDTSKEALENAIAVLQNDIDGLRAGLGDGSFVVKEASHATSATNAASATSATNATNAENATNATNASKANTADFAWDASRAGKLDLDMSKLTHSSADGVGVYTGIAMLPNTAYMFLALIDGEFINMVLTTTGVTSDGEERVVGTSTLAPIGNALYYVRAEGAIHSANVQVIKMTSMNSRENITPTKLWYQETATISLGGT